MAIKIHEIVINKIKITTFPYKDHIESGFDFSCFRCFIFILPWTSYLSQVCYEIDCTI